MGIEIYGFFFYFDNKNFFEQLNKYLRVAKLYLCKNEMIEMLQLDVSNSKN